MAEKVEMEERKSRKSGKPEILVEGYGIVERTHSLPNASISVTFITVRGSKGYIGRIKALGRLAEEAKGLAKGDIVYLQGYLDAWEGEVQVVVRRLRVALPYIPEEEIALRVSGLFFLGPHDYRLTDKGTPFLQGLLRLGEGGDIRFSLFGEAAERVADHLTALAHVQGFLTEETWTTKDGEKRYAAKVRAVSLYPLKWERKEKPPQKGAQVPEEPQGEPGDILEAFPEDLPF